MKVLFCGGGTGGHVTPALAIADILKKHYKEPDIAFVGRSGGDENKAISNEGYELYTLDICGFRRSLSLKNINAVFKTLRAERKAKKLIDSFKPDIIIGTGGYVCWPVLRAGNKRGIPTILHESNAYPGLVTRMLGHKCSRLLLNYPEAQNYLKDGENVIISGNPIRAGLFKYTRAEARRRLKIKNGDFFILSFGGSLGAERINQTVLDLMSNHCALEPGIVHFHATGRKSYEAIKKMAPPILGETGRCRLIPYIEDMPLYLCAADLAITRSGAMTLSELAAAALPAILIPSPNVAADHQRRNAEVIGAAGGAIVIDEGLLDSNVLWRHIKRLRGSSELRRRMSCEMSKLQRQDTEGIILGTVKSLCT